MKLHAKFPRDENHCTLKSVNFTIFFFFKISAHIPIFHQFHEFFEEFYFLEQEDAYLLSQLYLKTPILHYIVNHETISLLHEPLGCNENASLG